MEVSGIPISCNLYESLQLDGRITLFIMKSARWRRKHCALAVVRRSLKFRPTEDPLPGARDGQNLISWRWSLPLPANPVWWGSIHAISSYRGNRSTNTQTVRGDYNTVRRSFASA